MPPTVCANTAHCGAATDNQETMKNTLRVIYIMWLRQFKRYLRSRSRIIGSLAQPLLFLFALGYGFGGVYQQAGEGNYLDFLAPGIMCMSILFTSMFSGIEIIWDRQFGFLKETLVAPVSRTTIMLGRIMGGATVATLQGTIVLMITLFIGFSPTNWYLVPFALSVMFLIATLFTALGSLIGTRIEDMQGFQLIMGFLVMPMFFLSGALFPLDNVPSAMVFIARLDPLSYGVDAMRTLLTGVSHLGLGLDIAVMSVVTVGLVALGSWSFSKMQV